MPNIFPNLQWNIFSSKNTFTCAALIYTASSGNVSKFTTYHSIISKMSSIFKSWVHLRFWVFSKVHVLNVFTQSLMCWICDCSYSNYYNYANKIFLSIHVLEKIDPDKSIHMAICLHSFSKRLACTWLLKPWHVSVSSTLLHVLQALLINRQFLCIIWFSNRWMFRCFGAF